MESDEVVRIYEDNQGYIALVKNLEFHKRTKHIDIRYHFIREYVESKQVNIVYISTNDMIADILTKPLGSTKFEHFRIRLRLINGNI